MPDTSKNLRGHFEKSDDSVILAEIKNLMMWRIHTDTYQSVRLRLN